MIFNYLIIASKAVDLTDMTLIESFDFKSSTLADRDYFKINDRKGSRKN